MTNRVNLAVTPITSTDLRSGTRAPSGDAAIGLERAVQNTQQVLSCQKMKRDQLRAMEVGKGGVH